MWSRRDGFVGEKGKSSKGIYRLRQHCKRKMMDKQNKEWVRELVRSQLQNLYLLQKYFDVQGVPYSLSDQHIPIYSWLGIKDYGTSPVIYLVLERLAGNPGARALPGLPSWLARPARWPASSALPPHPRPFFNLKQTNASCRNRKMYFFATSLSLSPARGSYWLYSQ